MRFSAMGVMGVPARRFALVVLFLTVAFLYLVIETKVSYRLPVVDVSDLADDTPSERIVNQVDSSDFNRTIFVHERYCLSFDIDGYSFNEHGRSRKFDATATSCLLHSFSPYVEREAAKRFIDPAHQNVYFANSPAITYHKGEIVLVTRIWLDREKYEQKQNWPLNHFADNYFYTQRFDRHMKPVSSGSIMGIPTPKQWWVGDGPIEPRIFEYHGRLFVTFNSAMAMASQYYMDYTLIWDMERNIPIFPKIEGGSPMVNATEKNDMPRDKHWMALINHGNLYFVHNFDPFRVLTCRLDGYCKFVHQEFAKDGFIFSDTISHLRGGTPFELYAWPYYISVAHTTMYKNSNNHRYYTSHLVLICIQPYRIVYISNDIKIHEKLYEQTPIVRSRYIDDGFIFPVGLIVETKDSLAIGVHISDYSSVIVRLRSLEKLLSKVIALDKQEANKRGPPLGYIHKHIHDTLENLTNIALIHERSN